MSPPTADSRIQLTPASKSRVTLPIEPEYSPTQLQISSVGRNYLLTSAQISRTPQSLDWPELELTFPDSYAGFLTDFLTDSPIDSKNYGSIAIGLVSPFSRGNVTINSTDTANNPVINPNWLGDPRDQDLAVQAFRRTRQIFQTKALSTIVIGAEAFPGANVTTDEEILSIIMRSVNTIYHAAATNAMGTANDSNAVVDSVARVIGVSGLRVVDASIFPFLPPGHPMSTFCGSNNPQAQRKNLC